jgi:hypothetical protein
MKTRLPSKEEMKEMRKLELEYDIDPTIRSAIIDLNKNGFKTIGSCSGHKKGDRGYISFGGEDFQKIDIFRNNKKRIIKILTNHGFKRLEFEHPRWTTRNGERVYSPWYWIYFTRRI